MDITAVNWNGDLTALSDDDLDARCNALLTQIGFNTVYRQRDHCHDRRLEMAKAACEEKERRFISTYLSDRDGKATA